MRFFIDIQGTLISDEDKTPLPGAKEFIELLNSKNIPYIAVTNNTKEPSEWFLTYLKSQGLNLKNYIDPLMVLKEVLRVKRVAGYGANNFLLVLKELGYELDYQNPQAVVLSVKKYKFEEFADIVEFLLSGAKLYGMHKTSLFVENGRRYPAVGALLSMFEFACKVESEVVGKPSELFFKKALERIGGGDFSDVVMISDDPIGDLAGAKELGMKTVFVLTGKFKNPNEVKVEVDLVCSSLMEVAKKLGVL